ncbi:inactive pancreatic lipase-related protein 1-like [Uloborus diversus]|uniref:inactive pancreatic lipase-related protein 1-like n=1 Tax=Uloborus diversus TaxID=327109 RepID=UPI002409ECCF|nr:inactive pancreatic lipase-related protein 1-like [Uloborus diversus]
MWGNTFDPQDTFYNAKHVAKQVAAVVDILKENFNLTHKDFSCTGHSYGAHLCGYLGQETHISIINALEANGVLLTQFTSLDDRLDPGDADCVQAIHTNDGQCLPFFGINYTIGTVDIYLNGEKYKTHLFRLQKMLFSKETSFMVYAFRAEMLENFVYLALVYPDL